MWIVSNRYNAFIYMYYMYIYGNRINFLISFLAVKMMRIYIRQNCSWKALYYVHLRSKHTSMNFIWYYWNFVGEACSHSCNPITCYLPPSTLLLPSGHSVPYRNWDERLLKYNRVLQTYLLTRELGNWKLATSRVLTNSLLEQ